MSHFIEKLSIRNFKSIRSVDLDCARINVFVGKPNVGKSNVLEALALFGAMYSRDKWFSGQIRYNSIKDLFHNQDWSKPCIVNIGPFTAMLTNEANMNRAYINAGASEDRAAALREAEIPVLPRVSIEDSIKIAPFQSLIDIDGKNSPYSNGFGTAPVSAIKKYHFQEGGPINDPFSDFLLPAFGQNFFQILQSNKAFRKDVKDIFSEYGYELVLDKLSMSFEIFKRDGDDIYKISYNLVADTIQRYLFHLAAIESNRDSILLFEEPESHSFPPYVQQLAYRMDWSTSNQFFVATHSPYLLNTLVEESKDVAVFICNYENYETKIHRLTEEDLSDMLNYGIEIFYNLERFLPHVEA